MDIFTIFGILFLICLFLLILSFIYFGRKYALWLESRSVSRKNEGIQVTQSAIFALLGLLLAFTFSGALTKFDQRRTLMINEANAISTLHLRFSLLHPNAQNVLNQDLRSYLDLRLKIYSALPDINAARSYYLKSLAAQDKLWKDIITNISQSKSPYDYLLILPTVNEVFDIANTRINLVKMHPPYYLFFLLVFIALISAFLVGSTIFEKRKVSPLHIIIFSLVITVVIFSIIDMEYPRIGFIRVNSFDRVLINLQEKLKE
ncbi:MAG: hypothetical protein ACE365_00150 [Gammaproteobacteria bacterium]